MFNRRKLEVKIVKDKKESTGDTYFMPPPDYVKIAQKIVHESGKDTVVGVVAVIGSYVVLDTLRKVTIEIVKAKL